MSRVIKVGYRQARINGKVGKWYYVTMDYSIHAVKHLRDLRNKTTTMLTIPEIPLYRKVYGRIYTVYRIYHNYPSMETLVYATEYGGNADTFTLGQWLSHDDPDK